MIYELLMAKLFGGGSGGGGGDAHGIPSGGTTGQVLAKTSNTDYSAAWSTPRTVPTGGSSGQVLTRYGSSGDYVWQSVSVPSDALIGETWLETEGNRTRIHYSVDNFASYMDSGKKFRIYDDSDNSTIMYLIAAGDYYDEDLGDSVMWAYFIDVSGADGIPRIRYFVREYDEDFGDYLYYEQTPPTHAVTGTWVGTAAEYAALSPNYDANTIYYIKGDLT